MTINTATLTTTHIGNSLEFVDGYPLVILPDGSDYLVTTLLGKGDSNAKLKKNSKRGFATAGLSLAPSDAAGIGNTCVHASAGCRAACLFAQGRASVWQTIGEARIAKTIAFYRARDWFVDHLCRELEREVASADRKGLDLCCRLNVFSDIPWELIAPQIFDRFPTVQFYDYSKNPRRVGRIRPNYWITFSRSETNETRALELLSQRKNVAIVFATAQSAGHYRKGNHQPLPKTWNGFPVIDGDETDLRFLDSRGTRYGRVVGLHLKTSTNADYQQAIDSGFAIQV